MRKEEDKIDKLGKSISKLSQAVKAGFSAVDKKFDGVDKRFDGVDKRFEDVDKRFDVVDKRFDGVDKKFGEVDGRFNGIDQRLNNHDKRFSNIDKSFKDTNKLIGDLAASTAIGFEKMQKYSDNRFEMVDIALLELRKDARWTRDVLDKHAGWNLTLDQERIFTISRIDRLEGEINKVKAKIGVK